jgi:hypothetical protein
MTAFALAAPSPRPHVAASSLAVWTALALAFAALLVPDCCLNGHHAAGFGMELFGPIRHAAR